MNAAFMSYKKRKLFNQVVDTVDSLVYQIQDEKDSEELARIRSRELSLLDPKIA